MRNLIIIGAGSVGGHIANNLKLYGLEDRLLGFLDDDVKKQGGYMFGYPVIGPVSWILDQVDCDVVIGIAFPSIKKKILDLISVNESLNYPTLIARDSWISNDCTVGKGSIVYPGVCVNYGSVIDEFVVLNMNCAIGHNCTVSSYCSLAPGVNLGGHTYLEESVQMGIGASTVQSSVIGKGAIVGGQAMVIHHVPSEVTVVGVPAASRRTFILKPHPDAVEVQLAQAADQ
jgi:sugar O-acyltransferase (sialic acid O-acetyltransferase NeuD family)